MQSLSSIAVCIALLCWPAWSQVAPKPTAKTRSTRTTERDRPHGVDQLIRDTIVMLYPSWRNGGLDIFVSGRRITGEYFGVYPWYFVVTPMTEASRIVHGFSPGAAPCPEITKCEVDRITGTPYLIGKFVALKDGEPVYEGSRPEIAKKNINFGSSIRADADLSEIASALERQGAHYAPGSVAEASLRKQLSQGALFSSSRSRLVTVQFCRTISLGGPSRLAMFWLAKLFSARWNRKLLVTIEPFEGDVTSILPITSPSPAIVCGR